ncbi:MAG: AI-2E family transporter [Chloroflexales bacterium]|nr:AI-2E family transporter [Chloroflexales bacterium]
MSVEQWAWMRKAARALLVVAALYVVGWLFYTAGSALLPFIVGLILAYLLLPLVNRLTRSVPRWVAILMVYGLAFGLFIAFIIFIVPPIIAQVGELVRSIPSIDQLEQQSNQLLAWYNANVPADLKPTIDTAASRAVTSIQNNLTTYAQNVGTFALNTVLGLLNTLGFIFGFLIVPFWLFYVLKDQQAGVRAMDRLLPQTIRKDVWAILGILDGVFSKYIRGQLFLGVVVGAVAGAGLLVLSMLGIRVPYILLLAIFAGLTELIPVVGPIIGAIPAVVLALFSDNPLVAVLAVVALYAAIQQLENAVLVPRIVGESVNLHPAVLMVLLVVCSQAFGLLGAILAAPASAAARDIFNYLYRRLSPPEAQA